MLKVSTCVLHACLDINTLNIHSCTYINVCFPVQFSQFLLFSCIVGVCPMKQSKWVHLDASLQMWSESLPAQQNISTSFPKVRVQCTNICCPYVCMDRMLCSKCSLRHTPCTRLSSRSHSTKAVASLEELYLWSYTQFLNWGPNKTVDDCIQEVHWDSNFSSWTAEIKGYMTGWTSLQLRGDFP